MQLSKAIQGFLLDRSGDSKNDLSPHTINLYRKLLNSFCNWLEDPLVANIQQADVAEFMRYLETEYQQESGARLSSSARDNYWKSIRSFFKWSAAEFNIPRPDKELKRPQVVNEEIVPYTQDQVKKILDYCEFTAPSEGKRKPYRQRRANGLRDKAIVMLLLETGIRVGELSRLKMRDVDIDAGEIHVKPYHSSVKSKPRTIPIEKSVQKILWKYRVKYREDADWEDSFFELDSVSLIQFFWRMSERTNIPDVHAHRFRHTFAIEYLRNGGDVFTLQRLLGHSSLVMVKRYLAIAQSDIKTAHKRASPVEKWKL